MVKVVERECLEEYQPEEWREQDTSFRLQPGKVYTTTADEKNGAVTLFSSYWVNVPVRLFGPPYPLGKHPTEMSRDALRRICCESPQLHAPSEDKT